MEYSRYRYLSIEITDGIALMTLSRPEKMNACRESDHSELASILRDMRKDPGVKVAIVTGAGRAFSVGGDLELMQQMVEDPEARERLLDDARELIASHIDFNKPIIAAVNGVAMGAAATFALLCDFIVMEEQASIADGHTRAALPAGDGGTLIWPLAIGITKAKRYLLTGDALTAAEAERLGLITEVVKRGESVKRAKEIAYRLAGGPLAAIGQTKQAIHQWLRLGMIASFDYSAALETAHFSSGEVREAVADLTVSKTSAMLGDSRNVSGIRVTDDSPGRS